MQDQNFSMRGRVKSFSHAISGIRRFLKSEHNARIHLVATLAVVFVGVALKVSRLEWAALVIAIGLVWVTEMLNTCLERTMDFISRERHPRIQFIKDLAAGTVLVAAIVAVIIGAFVFIPHIF